MVVRYFASKNVNALEASSEMTILRMRLAIIVTLGLLSATTVMVNVNCAKKPYLSNQEYNLLAMSKVSPPYTPEVQKAIEVAEVQLSLDKPDSNEYKLYSVSFYNQRYLISFVPGKTNQTAYTTGGDIFYVVSQVTLTVVATYYGQ